VEEVINESVNDVNGLHDESTAIYDTRIDNLKFNKNLKKRTANQRLWKINTVLFSKQSLSVSQISGSETPGQIPGLISNTEQLINENNSEINGIDNDYEYDKHFKKNELKSFYSDPKIALTDWMQVFLIFKFFYIFVYVYIYKYIHFYFYVWRIAYFFIIIYFSIDLHYHHLFHHQACYEEGCALELEEAIMRRYKCYEFLCSLLTPYWLSLYVLRSTYRRNGL
jgi:hypothetical protein